jgi:thioester reductase-like protein
VNVFLTGSTGFLGGFLAAKLLENNHRVFALARGGKTQSALERVHSNVSFAFGGGIINDSVLSQLKVFDGDITIPNFGITEESLRFLINETDIVVHSAALAEITFPLEEIRKINVAGTLNVLNFAKRCKQVGRLRKFNHISTVYIAGNRLDGFSEDCLGVGQAFHNTYEQSKYEAEILLKDFPELGISVFRPSMVIGHSADGRTSHFRLFYQPLRHIVYGLFDNYPADLSCDQNLINIDTVVNVIFELMFRDENATYHVVSPENVNIGFFFKKVSDYFDCPLPKFIANKQFDFNSLSNVQRQMSEPFVPYFNSLNSFSGKKTHEIIHQAGISFPVVGSRGLGVIFDYCVDKKFLRKH